MHDCTCWVNCLHLALTLLRLAQDAQAWYERNRARHGGGEYLAYGWDSSIWGVNLQLASLTSNSAPVWAAEVRWAVLCVNKVCVYR